MMFGNVVSLLNKYHNINSKLHNIKVKTSSFRQNIFYSRQKCLRIRDQYVGLFIGITLQLRRIRLREMSFLRIPSIACSRDTAVSSSLHSTSLEACARASNELERLNNSSAK